MKQIIRNEIRESASNFNAICDDEALVERIAEVATVCVAALGRGNKILFAGNGGSAADAQHIATELTVRYNTDRPAIAALALTTDSSALTAIGNDFNFDSIFSRQVEALVKPNDFVIGISTSGNSPNVLLGLAKAKELGCRTGALSGRGGGKLRDVADILLVVPSQVTARIQEMHIIIAHSLCEAIERELGYSNPAS